jgi:hypothetical protein
MKFKKLKQEKFLKWYIQKMVYTYIDFFIYSTKH